MEVLLYIDFDSAGDSRGAGQRGMAARNTVHEHPSSFAGRFKAASEPLQSWEKSFCDSEYPQGVEMSVDLDMLSLQEQALDHLMLIF